MAEHSGPASQEFARPWMAKFLELYMATGNITLSARGSGIERTTVYRQRRSDPVFAAALESSHEAAIDMLEAEARRRAMNGSDTLLIFMLKAARPDVYRETIRIDVRREAERIAAELGMSDDDVLAAIAEVERMIAVANGVGGDQ